MKELWGQDQRWFARLTYIDKGGWRGPPELCLRSSSSIWKRSFELRSVRRAQAGESVTQGDSDSDAVGWPCLKGADKCVIQTRVRLTHDKMKHECAIDET
jgi:hypothetical protein